MAILFRKLKTLEYKKALAVVLLGGLAALALSYFPAQAESPDFNIFTISCSAGTNTDLPLLDVRNATKNQRWCNRSVEADPNDQIEFSIYFHNGARNVNETIARSAFAKAFATPFLGDRAQSHTFGASVGASNAATVTSLAKGGNVTVNIRGGVAQSLELVPGSTFLFKDCGLKDCTVFSNGQQVADTIFTSGVGLGDVRGCFEFHGFVNFKVRVSQAAVVGDLQVVKEVKNVSDTTGFSNTEVAADPDETVEFRITVSALNNPVNNVTVRDAKDTRLAVIGTVTSSGTIISSTDFFSGGISLGTINAGSSRTIIFQAKVPSRNSLGVGNHLLTNEAFAAGEGKSAQDRADVRVLIQAVLVSCPTVWEAPLVPGTNRGLRKVGDPDPAKSRSNVFIKVTGLPANASFTIVDQHVTGSPTFEETRQADAAGNFEHLDRTVIPNTFVPGDYNVFIKLNNVNVATCPGFKIEADIPAQIDVQKLVKNERVGGSFVEDQVDNVQPGDLITFQIVIKNASNATQALQNVIIRDTLPGKLIFVENSFKVDGATRSNPGFFVTGFHLNEDIGPAGGQKTITFQATVASVANFTVGSCEVVTNSVTAQASGVNPDSDTASVRVCPTAVSKAPGQPGPRPTDP